MDSLQLISQLKPKWKLLQPSTSWLDLVLYRSFYCPYTGSKVPSCKYSKLWYKIEAMWKRLSQWYLKYNNRIVRPPDGHKKLGFRPYPVCWFVWRLYSEKPTAFTSPKGNRGVHYDTVSSPEATGSANRDHSQLRLYSSINKMPTTPTTRAWLFIDKNAITCTYTQTQKYTHIHTHTHTLKHHLPTCGRQRDHHHGNKRHVA